ncbi:bifunctional diaminohydroxyphosphoribosylaminopyrimidine deaminase/5-amino-6-(5-phosphoribosylamino)uracil reductase RibD [Venenivibrio stagnispumantis]|uniref:Riboflavin biosynthesis protein RibD n=1 Tax=Venenivibrio stagnispumantis TaxID=407998 RepID=A0AA46AFR7_9AQUI|nr:bifunctional diaminohydroxyphosphoribosylaminopyrimidine deaminase/5-amino-6-(5-phosphoribosylamino)uracil reductase RibD [Venenivibrio stagnispumantis]MCW4574008.1 bifunctional diaminohydroxyphosphoribosylaminopyrimidine deaminase/5-amino-6-(5-phosphoribosylamino)uracil reductase RibD [Venenivibrio stagnispumantis]SMP21175.1 diaminohydroxyphosphoribosylaminopyrimidine deaminase [Venenivibrio stagnispumantis]
MNEDIKYMKRALQLAKKGKGYTHPNPAVGAVIVKDGKIIGEGYHKKAGMPHAEREAIKDAKEKGYDIKGSTMYVTLEPCCHYGRTPPCTNAIIEEGIKKVVVATLDPNPLVAGQGIEILKKAGIETKIGILQEEAKKLNEDFFVYITEKRPFIHLKIAQTIDGKIATKIGSSKWITSEKSRKFAHKLRLEASAVMVGVNTALKDNPSLTIRYIKSKKQPKRILIDRYIKTPIDFNIFNQEAQTILFCSKNADKSKIEKLREKNIKIYQLEEKEERLDLKEILKILAEEEQVIHLLVEGGKDLITQFIKNQLYDKISVFIAPKIVGEDGISSIGKLDILDIKDAKLLNINLIKKIDTDIYLELGRF